MSESVSESPRPRNRRRDTFLRWALLLAVVAGLGVTVGDQWSAVRESIRTVEPTTLVAAWLVATVGLLGPWRAWDAVVTDLGNPLPRHTSAEIFFVGQLGKYLPGAVWPVILQMRLAATIGLTRARVVVSFAVTLILGVATGVVIGTLVVPALVRYSRYHDLWLLLLILPPLALAALHPKFLNAGIRRALHLTRRDFSDVQLTGAAMRRAITGTCFFWCFGGLHLWLIAVALGASPAPALAVSIGSLALAVSLGPLFVFLPAGAGVREAILVAALQSVLPVPDAVAAALLSRAILVAGDGVLGLLSILVGRWKG